MQNSTPITETRAVELRLELPREIAEEIESVHRKDPEILNQILLYGLTRRAIFDGLSRRDNSSRQTG